MARLIKTLLVLSIGSWFSLVDAQQPVKLPADTVWISDLGLEEQIPSAIDLIGPEGGSAGRNRDALARRMECWIDGLESCSVADANDARVREIRRFLTHGPQDRHGSMMIHFPDRTRIELRLERVTDLGPNDWDQRVYEPVVIAGSAQAPGLRAVPSRPGELSDFAEAAPPEIRPALERLKRRLEASVEAGSGTSAAADSSNE